MGSQSRFGNTTTAVQHQHNATTTTTALPHQHNTTSTITAPEQQRSNTIPSPQQLSTNTTPPPHQQPRNNAHQLTTGRKRRSHDAAVGPILVPLTEGCHGWVPITADIQEYFLSSGRQQHGRPSITASGRRGNMGRKNTIAVCLGHYVVASSVWRRLVVAPPPTHSKATTASNSFLQLQRTSLSKTL